MCGIVFVKSTNCNVKKAVRKRYNRQKNRGQRGFGFVTIKNEMVKKVSRATDSSTIFDDMEDGDGDSMLFHHRFPTSTANVEDASHPILVSNVLLEYDYYVVHNGVIRNAKERKVEHNSVGMEYNTEFEKNTIVKRKVDGKEITNVTESYEFNDSESLAIDLAFYLEGLEYSIKSRGSIAFIALQVEKGGSTIHKLFYAHNEANPLTIENRRDFFAITSEGGGEKVDTDKLYSYNYSTGQTSSEAITLLLPEYYHSSTAPYSYSGDYSKKKQISHTGKVIVEVDTKDIHKQTWRGRGKKKSRNQLCDYCFKKMKKGSYTNGFLTLCLTCYGEERVDLFNDSKECFWCGKFLHAPSDTIILDKRTYCVDCSTEVAKIDTKNYIENESGIYLPSPRRKEENLILAGFRTNADDEDIDIVNSVSFEQKENIEHKIQSVIDEIIEVSGEIDNLEQEMNYYMSDVTKGAEIDALKIDLEKAERKLELLRLSQGELNEELDTIQDNLL